METADEIKVVFLGSSGTLNIFEIDQSLQVSEKAASYKDL